MLSFTAQQLARQIHNLPPEKRIVLIHPNFKAQVLLINGILEHAVYMRLRGQALDETQLQQQWDEVSQQQIEQGGDSIQYLLIDEGDRALPEPLMRFVHRLSTDPRIKRIVLLSRDLPPGILADDAIRSQSTFTPVDTQLMLWDYFQSTDDLLLEVRAFGEGRVHLNGREVDSWDGALPRLLFFYLVDRAMVTRAEIFQTFWPTLTTREATNVFHVTKRKISEVLGTELTVYGSSFYHISPRIQLSYDVSTFNELAQENDTGSGMEALRKALALYRGNYLMSLKTDWVLRRRESLQQSCCDALVALGRLSETAGSPDEALNCYLRASRLKPEREDSALAIMRLYRDFGLPADALAVYNRLVKRLRASLNVAPSSQVQELAAQLSQ